MVEALCFLCCICNQWNTDSSMAEKNPLFRNGSAPRAGQRVQEHSDDYAVTMKVKVILFAVFRDIVGRKEEELDLEPGTTVQKLLDSYISRFPQMARFREHIILSVNKEYGPPGKVLREGDEVSFLPPVSGG
jgi:molybdopterin converting factor subunit 1